MTCDASAFRFELSKQSTAATFLVLFLWGLIISWVSKDVHVSRAREGSMHAGPLSASQGAAGGGSLCSLECIASATTRRNPNYRRRLSIVWNDSLFRQCSVWWPTARSKVSRDLSHLVAVAFHSRSERARWLFTTLIGRVWAKATVDIVKYSDRWKIRSWVLRLPPTADVQSFVSNLQSDLNSVLSLDRVTTKNFDYSIKQLIKLQ